MHFWGEGGERAVEIVQMSGEKTQRGIHKLIFPWGSFNNYVDMILPFFDHLPTSTWTFFTLNVDQSWHFLTTYPPHLVHVVFERPPKIWFFFLSNFSKLFNFSAIFVPVPFCELVRIWSSFLSILLCSNYIQSNFEVPCPLRSISLGLIPTVLDSRL